MGKHYHKFLSICAVAMLLILPININAAELELTSQEDSVLLIEELSQRTMAIITSDMLKSDKEAKMQSLLINNLDIERINLLIAGRAIRKASDEEKAEYNSITHDYISLKYAKLLSGYDIKTVEVINSSRIGRSDALVDVKIITANNQPVIISWRVSNKNQNLKVLDVIVEGISMLRSERQQFAGLIQANGFSGLIDILQKKLLQMTGG